MFGSTNLTLNSDMDQDTKMFGVIKQNQQKDSVVHAQK